MDKRNPDGQVTGLRNRSWFMWLTMAAGMILLALSMAASVVKGTVDIPVLTVWEAFTDFNRENSQHLIVADLRLPRAIASALVGAAFAVSGAIMQGVTRNPLADSGLMGLNAGAGFGLSICFAFFPGLKYMQILFVSFLGAALGASLVLGAASLRRGGADSGRLVLAGAAVSALLTALSQGIALSFNVAQSVMFWTTGGTAGSDWQQVRLLCFWIISAVLCSFFLARPISLMSLGEDAARGLGVNTAAVFTMCSVLVLILAGTAVSVVGSVGFVGLIVPHLARFLVGVDYRSILPVSAVFGALLVVLADLGARSLNPPFETPLGAVIALLGVPFFLYLARKQRRSRG